MDAGLATFERQVAAGVGPRAWTRRWRSWPSIPAGAPSSSTRAVSQCRTSSRSSKAPSPWPGRQHVSFYCLDASGLGSGGRQSTGKRRIDREGLTSRGAEDLFRRVRISEMDRTGGLGPLAELTGGIIRSDTNDITAITEAAFGDRPELVSARLQLQGGRRCREGADHRPRDPPGVERPRQDSHRPPGAV